MGLFTWSLAISLGEACAVFFRDFMDFSRLSKKKLEDIAFFNIFKVNFKHADLKFWISDQALLNLEVTLKVPFFFANVTWAEMRFEIC